MNDSILEEMQVMFPVNGNFDLIKCTDYIIFKNILDIGLGMGGASLFFAEKGKNVTALGLAISSYQLSNIVLNHPNIHIVEKTFEDFDTDEKFDAILMSHVLEHTQNPGYFLEKAFNLLNENGWLFVMVPPYKEEVVGGHITNGWNTGQLMYNLLLSGFDIKKGRFVCHGHNICAFVQQSKNLLPKLRMDKGDIESTKEFWPIDVKQGFKGDINRINWFQGFNNIPHKSYAVQLEIKDKIIAERDKLFDVLVQKDRELKKRQRMIEEKDAIIEERSQLYDVLAQKDVELKKRQRMIEEKDEIIKERSKLYDVLAQKDEELKKRQLMIEEKDAIIEERGKLYDVLAQKDEDLKRRQQIIEQKDAIINGCSQL